ncbi:ATP-binding response regulator [Halocalculus aciditolerans]|uniref:ATP-binding response regulator n=1 Tax=Halocalculus aciditolerans TaxID=1383812 RepID=UPI001665314B|nr:hybrid sensor histidine kinase/response regulator [Halocalculus aciditolerans]
MSVVVHARTGASSPSFDPSGFGVTVKPADSVEGVVDALAASRVDCVVCAVDPASGDGLDVLRAVRDRDPALPVLAYTDADDAEAAAEVTRAGATEYVSAERLTDADAALRDRIRALTDAGTPLGPVVESSPDPTLLLAGDYTVRYRNAAAADFAPATAVGDSVFDVVHDADADAVRAAAEHGDSDGSVVVRLRDGEGEWRRASVRVADRRADRRVNGFVVTMRDASDAAVDEHVVAQAVHDLRTPLATARTYLDIARDDPDRLDDVDAAHDRLETLVDDLRTLATAGRALDEPERVDPAAIAREAWETSGAADVTFVVDTDPDELAGDPERLRRLFENLFRNACDHGASTVRLAAVDGGFAVEDDGDGIPESDRDAVFEQGFTTRDDGTGYGLAIVEEIADAHGLTARVEESADGGARFVFTRDTHVGGRDDSKC